MEKFLIVITSIIAISFAHNSEHPILEICNPPLYFEENTEKCATDADCPVINCISAPCPNNICNNYRCVLVDHEPSVNCHRVCGNKCVEANETYENENLTSDSLDMYCYDRFGVCNLHDGECVWEMNRDFRFCLLALGD